MLPAGGPGCCVHQFSAAHSICRASCLQPVLPACSVICTQLSFLLHLLLQVLRAYLHQFFSPAAVGGPGTRVQPLMGTRAVIPPTSAHLPDHLALIDALPDSNPPAVFGLPDNIDKAAEQAASARVVAQLKQISAAAVSPAMSAHPALLVVRAPQEHCCRCTGCHPRPAGQLLLCTAACGTEPAWNAGAEGLGLVAHLGDGCVTCYAVVYWNCSALMDTFAAERPCKSQACLQDHKVTTVGAACPAEDCQRF